jgi:hypothetical protein
MHGLVVTPGRIVTQRKHIVEYDHVRLRLIGDWLDLYICCFFQQVADDDPLSSIDALIRIYRHLIVLPLEAHYDQSKDRPSLDPCIHRHSATAVDQFKNHRPIDDTSAWWRRGWPNTVSPMANVKKLIDSGVMCLPPRRSWTDALSSGDVSWCRLWRCKAADLAFLSKTDP